MNTTGNATKFLLLAFCVIACVCAAPFFGMETLSPFSILSSTFDSTVFFSLRLPRVIIAFTAGAGLALCGMVFQAMFRNPLADPFTLGIASGASCGAAFTILLGLNGAVLGMPIVSIGAFCGAALSMAMVSVLSSLRRTSSNISMLLAGIAISFLFSSLLMFMQYLSSLRDSFHIVRWLMGGIEVFGYSQLFSMLPFTIVGMAIILMKLPELDHLLSGEDLARTRGVRVGLTRRLLIFAATLIVGSIVAVCGPIGFIGLMIPHMCRMVFKANHRVLGPVSIAAGGLFLVVCDTVARIVIAPAEMPVGVITALLGGPFFLWLLFVRRAEGLGLD
jgi:iron complex transport system permease protein